MKKIITSFLISLFLLSNTLGASIDYLEGLIGRDVVIVLRGEHSIRGTIKEILTKENYTKQKEEKNTVQEITQFTSSIIVLEAFYNKDIRNHSIIYLDSNDVLYIIEK